ncbi:chemotaxis protein CheW [Geomonas sp. RF6]|nr:chemotaxis protein CheW [Geomonas sp. RF6]
MQRVVRAAAVTPLPKAPAVVLGILDLQGTVAPVFDLRKRFALPEREILPDDQFIIARAGARTVVLAVDEATEVLCGENAIIPPDQIQHGTGYLSGVTRTAAGLVLIHDLESFLSLEEEATLAAALQHCEG